MILLVTRHVVQGGRKSFSVVTIYTFDLMEIHVKNLLEFQGQKISFSCITLYSSQRWNFLKELSIGRDVIVFSKNGEKVS